MSILNEIQIRYPNFSKTEKKVADYILLHKEQLMNIHIRELANRINVSEATITRFSKKIGCKNFVELKIMLRGFIEEKESETSIIGQVNNMYDNILKATRSLIVKSDLETTVQWINEAKDIYVYGVESSGLTATEMKRRFERMGYRVSVETDSHGMIIASSSLKSDDLVIAISNSGQTNEVVEACELAKKNGTRVIAITNHEQTPLSKTANLILFTSNLQTQEMRGLINSQFSMVYILDLISMYLLQQKGPFDHYEQTVQALNDYKKI